MSYLTENAVEILTDYSVNGGLWVMADINNLKRAGHDWGMCKEIISAEVVSPISVSNLPAKVHSNFFKMKNGNYMVSIVNDFTNIKTSRSKNKRSNESKVVLDVVVKTNINPIVSVANAVNGEVLNYTCNNNKCDIFVPSFYDGIFIEIRFY